MDKIYNYDGMSMALEVTSYCDNDNLAIQVWEVDSDGQPCEPYARLTVNLGDKLPNYTAYVDTNNWPDAADFIEDNELGVLIGWGHSGYCDYPKYLFDVTKLK